MSAANGTALPPTIDGEHFTGVLDSILSGDGLSISLGSTIDVEARHILADTGSHAAIDWYQKVMTAMKPNINTSYRFVLHIPIPVDDADAAHASGERIKAMADSVGDHYTVIEAYPSLFWGCWATNNLTRAKELVEAYSTAMTEAKA